MWLCGKGVGKFHIDSGLDDRYTLTRDPCKQATRLLRVGRLSEPAIAAHRLRIGLLHTTQDHSPHLLASRSDISKGDSESLAMVDRGEKPAKGPVQRNPWAQFPFAMTTIIIMVNDVSLSVRSDPAL